MLRPVLTTPNTYYRPAVPKESYRWINVELPTPSAIDVRCRALERRNKWGTKRMTGTAAEFERRTGMRE